jgi:NAD(P)-dependent dehydrogenase (short-subunit alcohol dehydrogenase family)
MIRALVQALPPGVHGIANVAGLPPTAPAELVLKVNLVGLRAFTLAMIPKLADGASIVNLASLAGFGWANQVSSILESEVLDFDEVADFVRTHDAGDEGGRSYFFSKEALIAWTMRHRWPGASAASA